MGYNYSIVVPYYDKYDLFLKAVESIPDRADIQIIIVDNARVSLSKKELPVKERSQIVYATSSPTRGAGCARNVGLHYVKGKYTLFLDADDYFTATAFDEFDRYLNQEYDIVFFKPTSLRLKTGTVSNRHISFAKHVDDYIINKNEAILRYRWFVPWSKLFLSQFILENKFTFEEIQVSNDLWFSLMSGHHAKRITADSSIVYVVTEGSIGESLVQTVTKENAIIRYQEAIKVNKFLKSVGRYEMRIRLLGALRIALVNFGLKEFFYYLRIALQNRINII